MAIHGWYFAWWLLDVLVLSIFIAVFEIFFEKDNGWASGLSQHGLGKRLWQGTTFVRLFEKPYITVYHLTMFGAIVPLILVGQYWIVRVFLVSHAFAMHDIGILTIWQVGSVRFMPLFSIIAAWLAISTIEDFMWFALNWYYPTSLQDLFSGRIWWHTRWIALGKIKVPRFYISTLVIAAVFLYASTHIARIAGA